MANVFERLKQKILQKKATIGIIGLGYVGLPLVRLFSSKGFLTIGFDIDIQKVKKLNSGRSYILSVPSDYIKQVLKDGLFQATNNFSNLKKVDAILICVPTPLTDDKRPNLSFVKNTAMAIGKNLRRGHLVILESTTYPGTTREVVLPALSGKRLRCGRDFFVAFSPEREDPGNKNFSVENIPKVVGGIDKKSLQIASLLYKQVLKEVVEVSSCEVAEATKLLENIYRGVNIALVNELKILLDKMGINIWEVISAASTKPFGFQPFYPGPGWGGHCIPVDPFYLSWRAREFQFVPRFIELSGEINTQMPYYVVNKLQEALKKNGQELSSASILILGLSYKKDIDDPRESPSFKIIEILLQKGAKVAYNDPYFNEFPKMRHYNFCIPGANLTPKNISKFDAIILCTDHSQFDYKKIAKYAKLIIDTRNAFQREGIQHPKIILS